jgi:hypothetical protein
MPISISGSARRGNRGPARIVTSPRRSGQQIRLRFAPNSIVSHVPIRTFAWVSWLHKIVLPVRVCGTLIWRA